MQRPAPRLTLVQAAFLCGLADRLPQDERQFPSSAARLADSVAKEY
jgi:hypothetical protein